MAAASSPAQSVTHDDINFNVVRFNRKRFHYLKAKRDPDFNCARGAMGEEPIKKTCSAANPGPRACKCNSGDEDNVDRTKNDNVVLTPCCRQNRYDFTAAPVQICDQRSDLGFVMEGLENNNDSCLFPNWQLEHPIADF